MWLTGSVAPRHVGSSQTRARTRVPCIGRQTPNHCATREAPTHLFMIPLIWTSEAQPGSEYPQGRTHGAGRAEFSSAGFRRKSTSQLIQVIGSCRTEAPTSLLLIGWRSLSAPRGCSLVQSMRPLPPSSQQLMLPTSLTSLLG